MLLKGMEFDATYFITDVSGKYPRLWALKGAYPVTVNRWYKFGALTSIRTIAPSFREISELPHWVDTILASDKAIKTRRAPPPRKERHEKSTKFGMVRKKVKDGPFTKKIATKNWSHSEKKKRLAPPRRKKKSSSS
ncbi:hypothetical protein ACS0TY_011622 [Phlomoides rotata]